MENKDTIHLLKECDAGSKMAVTSLDEVMEHTQDEKLKEIYSHLAGKEMSVGRYYQRNKEFVPALNRFQSVLLDYPNANQSSEALYRLASCYVALGMINQANQMLSILNYYYPQSVWTQKTKTLTQKYKKEK